MTQSEQAAGLFQDHRDELSFVNTAQCRKKDLVTVTADGNVVGALLGNHCVRKPQSTVYEVAVDDSYRRQGIASDLVADFAEDSAHDKLIAKCPVDLPANKFYANTGWEQINREEGKNRALNVWRLWI